MNRLKGASMFSSSGIAELYFKQIGIDILIANELLKKRADLYKFLYPDTKVLVGDIKSEELFRDFLSTVKEERCNFLIATPPCQGMSSLGKKDYDNDERNYLIFKVFDVIDSHNFDYILIENVPKFLKLYFPYNNEPKTLLEICKDKYSKDYVIESAILNAADYGVPQSRPRGFIKIYRKGLSWAWPNKTERINLKQAIGDLPELESGEDSGIKWHYAKSHNEREIIAMRHTKAGESALKNELHYPRTVDGRRVKGFHNTFKRMRWEDPSPARAKNSGNIGGHNNVHPGRLRSDGTVSDARVLTLRELFIVSSIPADIDMPEWCTDNFIRTVIGEAIPPKFCMKIVETLF